MVRSILACSAGAVPALSLLVLLAGCIGVSPPTADKVGPTDVWGETTTQHASTACENSDLTGVKTPTRCSDKPPEALDSRLYGLVTAENRSVYASNHSLRFENGSVLAVIELRPNRTLPTGFDGRVRARYDNLVQSEIPVCDLVPISEHRNVSFVRPPAEPEPAEPSIEGSY